MDSRETQKTHVNSMDKMQNLFKVKERKVTTRFKGLVINYTSNCLTRVLF
jgi:hypothetical protein